MSNTIVKNVSPEAMQVIVNIQGMRAVIYDYYDPIADFNKLSRHNLNKLRSIQNETLLHYNRKKTLSKAS